MIFDFLWGYLSLASRLFSCRSTTTYHRNSFQLPKANYHHHHWNTTKPKKQKNHPTKPTLEPQSTTTTKINPVLMTRLSMVWDQVVCVKSFLEALVGYLREIYPYEKNFMKITNSKLIFNSQLTMSLEWEYKV